MMSSLVCVDILPQFFLGSLGTGKKCCVLSSGSVVTMSGLHVRLGAMAGFRYMDLMGKGPNSFQWSRTFVNVASVALVFSIISFSL